MDIAEPKSLQSRVALDLRRRIDRRELLPGQRLPSRSGLAAQYKVSHMTIRGAMNELSTLGYVASKPRSGVFVSNRGRRGEAIGIGAKTVAIIGDMPLASVETQLRSHPGWSQATLIGALDGIGERMLHALTLRPQTLSPSALDDLADLRIFGAIIPETADRDSLIVCARALMSRGVPVVVAGNDTAKEASGRVVSDHRMGSYRLTQLLIERGRKNIRQVWLEPAVGYWYSDLRAGYVDAMKQAGLEPGDVIRLQVAPESAADESHYRLSALAAAGSLTEAFRSKDRPDALMVNTDGPALPVISACKIWGYEPNVDIDVVGYDNYWHGLPERRFETTMPLATVDKQNLEMGVEMVRMLVHLSQEASQSETLIWTVDPKIVIS